MSATSARGATSAKGGTAGLRWLGAAVIAAGLWLVGHGAWIPVKAWLAQQLIERAWDQRRAALAAAPGVANDPGFGRPWPWADTVPVARLRFERLDRQLIVLAGDSGAVLAFGPGHRSASAAPGAAGNIVISGHRDTHFALLRELQPGDAISLEAAPAAAPASAPAAAILAGSMAAARSSPLRSGPATVVYRIVDQRVVRADDPAAVASVLGDSVEDRLTLVTCWPFDAIDPGTPWRYVVTALSEPASKPGLKPGLKPGSQSGSQPGLDSVSGPGSAPGALGHFATDAGVDRG